MFRTLAVHDVLTPILTDEVEMHVDGRIHVDVDVGAIVAEKSWKA